MNQYKNTAPFGMSYTRFTALLAAYFTLIVNVPFYKQLITVFAQSEAVNIGFALSIPVFLWAILNVVFSFFSWPYIGKPVFIVLLLCSSVVSYAGYHYGVMFDRTMMANIFETDSSEAASYLSLSAITWVLLMGVVPVFWVYRVHLGPKRSLLVLLRGKMISIGVSLLLIAGVASVFYQNYVSVGRNNVTLNRTLIPTEFISSLIRYVNTQYLTAPVAYKTLGLDAQQTAKALQQAQIKPTLLVFVVGETARSQNYQMNGYPRPTNRYTNQSGIISFQDVSSCGTATAVSVPCMFSAMTRQHFSRQQADHQDNVLDLLQRADVDIVWRDNDGGDKQVAKHIKQLPIEDVASNKQCNAGNCYDMALLDGFEQHVEQLKGNRLMVLHLKGSHGPAYYQRYPSEHAQFLPDCKRSDIENCTNEQIINTYDNSILYTDYVLSQAIGRLERLQSKYNTALIYVSDHGESLGEEGLYLHGLPYQFAPNYQKRVPMLVWMSPSFQNAKAIDAECLRTHAQKKGTYSHDNVFHTLLGAMDVETRQYNPSLDLFERCRRNN
ncbi:phosphoethanolamine transferase [Vibrio ostreicida]|uniref:phosphoethanolamine transferase n=1 Tax=Vibrio ostreicida TaxID=526588 RepID=UPI003B5BBEE1